MVAKQLTLGHSRRDNLTNLMLFAPAKLFRLESRWEPYIKVGVPKPPKDLLGFEWGTFQYKLQHVNPLGHSTQMRKRFFYGFLC